MSSQLRANIERTIQSTISDSEFAVFLSLMHTVTYDKKTELMGTDTVCHYLYYIESGSCYSYMTDPKGNKHVILFALEDYWISDLYSFFSGQEIIYTIETLEPVQAMALSKENFMKACDLIPSFDRYFRMLIQGAYVSLQYRLACTNSKEAEARYQEFSRLHPAFVQRIPQYLIASYLGIKPQSLSRIRKEQVQRL